MAINKRMNLSGLNKEKIFLLVVLACIFMISENPDYKIAYILSFLIVTVSLFYKIGFNKSPLGIWSGINLTIPVSLSVFPYFHVQEIVLVVVCILNYLVWSRKDNKPLAYHKLLIYVIVINILLNDSSYEVSFMLFVCLVFAGLMIIKFNNILIKLLSVIIPVFIFCLLTNNILVNTIDLLFSRITEPTFSSTTQIGSSSSKSSIFGKNKKVELNNRILFYVKGEVPDSLYLYRENDPVISLSEDKVTWSTYSKFYTEKDYIFSDNYKEGGRFYVPEPDYAYWDNSIFYFHNKNKRYFFSDANWDVPVYIKFKPLFLMSIYNKESLINEKLTVHNDISIIKDKKRFSYDSFFIYKEKNTNKKTMDITFYSDTNTFHPATFNKVNIISGFGKYYELSNNSIVFRAGLQPVTIRFFYNDNEYISKRVPTFQELSLPENSIGLESALESVLKEAKVNPEDSIQEKINKIRQFFNANYLYTLNLMYKDKPRTLTDFLLRDRQGHCEFFATTTALLLRKAGIPTQYQTGIVLEKTGKDTYTGYSKKAHAWTLYWDGRGWKELDTTVSNEAFSPIEKIINMNSLNINIVSAVENGFKSVKGIVSNDKNNDEKSDFVGFIVNHQFKIILFVLIFLSMITFILCFKLIKHRKKYRIMLLERKLRKELAEYIKKYPKPDYLPWRIWAEESGEIFCIEKVKEFYNNVYIIKNK